MSLDAVPSRIKLDEVSALLKKQSGVNAIHDLHIWSMSTTYIALTCHCLTTGGHPGDEFLAQLAHELQGRFGMGHVTIPVEVHEVFDCVLEPGHVV